MSIKAIPILRATQSEAGILWRIEICQWLGEGQKDHPVCVFKKKKNWKQDSGLQVVLLGSNSGGGMWEIGLDT